MKVWKIIFLSKWVIWRFHVNLPGCIHHIPLVFFKEAHTLAAAGGSGVATTALAQGDFPKVYGCGETAGSETTNHDEFLHQDGSRIHLSVGV